MASNCTNLLRQNEEFLGKEESEITNTKKERKKLERSEKNVHSFFSSIVWFFPPFSQIHGIQHQIEGKPHTNQKGHVAEVEIAAPRLLFVVHFVLLLVGFLPWFLHEPHEEQRGHKQEQISQIKHALWRKKTVLQLNLGLGRILCVVQETQPSVSREENTSTPTETRNGVLFSNTRREKLERNSFFFSFWISRYLFCGIVEDVARVMVVSREDKNGRNLLENWQRILFRQHISNPFFFG
jgi:hypothetical protein